MPFALLPKRHWHSFNLPIANVATVSGFIAMFTGFAVAIPGYFRYLARLQGVQGLSLLEIGRLQVEGKLPENAAVSTVPMALYATAPLAFALFSPLGLFCTYLVFSSFVRIVTAYVDEPIGDPLLTLADAVTQRRSTRKQHRAAAAARTKLERGDEPDRRYDGEWAGLTDVAFVIVSARRKPGWTKGTWVITPDGWFVLGEPFDRPMPNGLRTIYPLTVQNTLEAVRKSVQYDLPPLRPSKTPIRSRETPKPDRES